MKKSLIRILAIAVGAVVSSGTLAWAGLALQEPMVAVQVPAAAALPNGTFSQLDRVAIPLGEHGESIRIFIDHLQAREGVPGRLVTYHDPVMALVACSEPVTKGAPAFVSRVVEEGDGVDVSIRLLISSREIREAGVEALRANEPEIVEAARKKAPDGNLRVTCEPIPVGEVCLVMQNRSTGAVLGIANQRIPANAAEIEVLFHFTRAVWERVGELSAAGLLHFQPYFFSSARRQVAVARRFDQASARAREAVQDFLRVHNLSETGPLLSNMAEELARVVSVAIRGTATGDAEAIRMLQATADPTLLQGSVFESSQSLPYSKFVDAAGGQQAAAVLLAENARLGRKISSNGEVQASTNRNATAREEAGLVDGAIEAALPFGKDGGKVGAAVGAAAGKRNVDESSRIASTTAETTETAERTAPGLVRVFWLRKGGGTFDVTNDQALQLGLDVPQDQQWWPGVPITPGFTSQVARGSIEKYLATTRRYNGRLLAGRLVREAVQTSISDWRKELDEASPLHEVLEASQHLDTLHAARAEATRASMHAAGEKHGLEEARGVAIKHKTDDDPNEGPWADARYRRLFFDARCAALDATSAEQTRRRVQTEQSIGELNSSIDNLQSRLRKTTELLRKAAANLPAKPDGVDQADLNLAGEVARERLAPELMRRRGDYEQARENILKLAGSARGELDRLLTCSKARRRAGWDRGNADPANALGWHPGELEGLKQGQGALDEALRHRGDPGDGGRDDDEATAAMKHLQETYLPPRISQINGVLNPFVVRAGELDKQLRTAKEGMEAARAKAETSLASLKDALGSLERANRALQSVADELQREALNH